MIRRILVGGAITLAAFLVLAQLVPVDRANPPVASDVAAPAEVHAVLKRACYDCHSNETVWPWYSRVAPVSWLVAWDVRDGRRELNYSVWGSYGPKKQAKKLKETVEEVAEGEMPPWYYRLMHPDAGLSAAERALLRGWASEARARPAGSEAVETASSR